MDDLTPAELKLLEKHPEVGLLPLPILRAFLACYRHVQNIKARQWAQ